MRGRGYPEPDWVRSTIPPIGDRVKAGKEDVEVDRIKCRRGSVGILCDLDNDFLIEDVGVDNLQINGLFDCGVKKDNGKKILECEVK